MAKQLEPVELPQNHVDFAKEMAECAKRHGIASFSLEYRPRFDGDNPELSYWGNLRVIFSQVDGRGRPDNKLKVSFESRAEHIIED